MQELSISTLDQACSTKMSRAVMHLNTWTRKKVEIFLSVELEKAFKLC